MPKSPDTEKAKKKTPQNTPKKSPQSKAKKSTTPSPTLWSKTLRDYKKEQKRLAGLNLEKSFAASSNSTNSTSPSQKIISYSIFASTASRLGQSQTSSPPMPQQATVTIPAEKNLAPETLSKAPDDLEEFKKKVREEVKQIKPKPGDNDLSLKVHAKYDYDKHIFTGLECISSTTAKKKKAETKSERLMEIGYRGEAIAYEELRRRYPESQNIKIIWHNEIEEAYLPYDISVEFSKEDGKIDRHYYEVKSTTFTEENEYVRKQMRFSKNETQQMLTQGENYHIIRIYEAESAEPVIVFINDIITKQFDSTIHSIVSFKLKC